MKKKGSTFLEIVVAITIFLIAILPVAYLTLNSLRALKRSSEIEEGARIATTVINYIKSRGYDNIIAGPLTGSDFSSSYHLSYDVNESAYVVVDSESGDIISTPDIGEGDFEKDFYNFQYNNSTTSGDAVFFIENLGIDLEGAKIDVVMKKANLHLAQETSPSGTYTYLNYMNSVSSTSTSSVIIGSSGLMKDSIIYGLVRVRYTSKAKPGESENEKRHEQTFVVTPLENFTN